MKKLIISISAIVLAANSFAFTLHHKQKMTPPHNLNINDGTEVEDFSGTWTGRCDDNDVKIIITQDDKLITFVFPGESDDETESDTFELDNLVSHSSSSSTSFRETSMSHAKIHYNLLSVTKITYAFDHPAMTQVSMEFGMLKQGETITLFDSLANFNTCLLRKG